MGRPSAAQGLRGGTRAGMRSEAVRLLRISVPLVINNLCGIGISVADAMMAGRVGPDALAGVAIGNAIWVPIWLLSIGFLVAVGPSVAHHYGAGEFVKIGGVARQGVWLALAIALLGCGMLAARDPLLARLGVDPGTARIASGYLGALAFGVPGLMFYQVLRQTAEGSGHTLAVMGIGAAALPVNVGVSYLFIFGKWGLPAYGAVGCGIGTAITFWLMLLAAAGYSAVSPHFRAFYLWRRLEWPSTLAQKALLAIGAPIGVSLAMQTGMFSAVAVMLSLISTRAIAAHQITLSLSSLIFMVPLGIAMGATILVGQARGAGDPVAARRVARVALALSFAAGCAGAILTLIARTHMARLYSDDPAVVALAAQMLGFATILHMGDGFQVGINGSLRGHKDTRVPMFILAGSYWGVGFSVAYLMTHPLGFGPAGAWVGLGSCLWVAGWLLWRRLSVIEARLAD